MLETDRRMPRKQLVIVDEFGYVPFSKTGSELLFEGKKVKITPKGGKIESKTYEKPEE